MYDLAATIIVIILLVVFTRPKSAIFSYIFSPKADLGRSGKKGEGAKAWRGGGEATTIN